MSEAATETICFGETSMYWILSRVDFCCFGPWHEPRYACAVVVEHGGAGSGVAGPIAREIMRATLLRDPSRRTPANLAQLEQNLARNA